MRKFYILFLVFTFAKSIKSAAQVIPDSLRVNWSQAGYAGVIPNPSTIINVKDFGAYGNGINDDYDAILKAINSSKLPRVIYFPTGNYLIKSAIVPPDNVIFRGDGTSTNLSFDLSASSKKDAFTISGKHTAAFTGIKSGYTKNSTSLMLDSTTGFTAGSYAEIKETNGSWNKVPADWATDCVGQIVKVVAVNGNQVTIDPALRITYQSNLSPQIRPVTLKSNVGFECLKITRIDNIIDSKYGNNISFTYAANCWVIGVESNKSQGAHILLTSSKNILVSGCYFHEAFTYDGTGTSGYGILMIQHNSDSKVENCIFKHLRHAMILKQGANGNIFAYNYSFDPYRSEIPHDAGGDMVLHGHYAFANLFEGNLGLSIVIDNTYGPSGPYNTFFRNRTDLYGISIQSQSVQSNYQNIVGNEVTNKDAFKGNYTLSGKQFAYGNNIKGKIQPTNTSALNDVSYHLIFKPYFWGTTKWPSVGTPNTISSGTIPAKDRYSTGNYIYCQKPPAQQTVIIAANEKDNNDNYENAKNKVIISSK